MNLQNVLIGLFLLITFGGNAQLYINEVLAGNQWTNQDEFFEYDDWVEVYNAGSIVNLAGYYFSDDPDSLDKWMVPDTDPGQTTVLPGGHLLFWFDNDPEQGEEHSTIRLSTDGESVFLTMPDGVTIVDSITFGEQQHDISYGRECDGCENWIYFNQPTPDDDNVNVQVPTEILYINEVLTVNNNNVQDQEGENEAWFEIFNPNPQHVNLSGYTIELNGTESFTFPYDDPTRTTVDEDGFQIFWADNEPPFSNHVSFNLPPEGGSLVLYGPDASVVDEYTFPALNPDESYGRTVDGGLSSGFFTIPTPRVTNTLIIIEPEELYINEVMAENDNDTLDTALENEDWIEIFNPNPYPVNVAGYWLSDNPENPTKWQIPSDHPDSSVIAPNDFLLFFADEQSSEGWNHTNFRLRNNGESVLFLSPDGFTVADQISFGTQEADTSFGRLTDGSPQWVLFTETTPEASNNGAAVTVSEKDGTVSVVPYPNPVNKGEDVQWDVPRKWYLYDATGRPALEGYGRNFNVPGQVSSGVYILLLDNLPAVRILVR